MARLNAERMAQDLFGLLFAIRETMFAQIESTDTEPLGGLDKAYRMTEGLLGSFGEMATIIGRLPDRTKARLLQILGELKDTEKPFMTFRANERERLVNLILDAGEVDNETVATMVTARGIKTSVVQVRTLRSARTKRLAPPAPTPVRKRRKKSSGSRPSSPAEKTNILDFAEQEGLQHDPEELHRRIARTHSEGGSGLSGVTPRSVRMILRHAFGEQSSAAPSSEPSTTPATDTTE